MTFMHFRVRLNAALCLSQVNFSPSTQRSYTRCREIILGLVLFPMPEKTTVRKENLKPVICRSAASGLTNSTYRLSSKRC